MSENQFEKIEIEKESILEHEHGEKPLDNFEIKDKEDLDKTEEDLSKLFKAEKEDAYNSSSKSSSSVSDQKMQELIELAFTKNINSAIKEARKLGPYTMDEFHDKLIKELRQRNINLN